MPAAASFREYARLLDFAAKLFQREIKWNVGIDDYLGHGYYQRDRLLWADRFCRG